MMEKWPLAGGDKGLGLGLGAVAGGRGIEDDRLKLIME